jgi:hypothetical protein
MNPKEVQRFLNTMDALSSRRVLYKHEPDGTDAFIELITEAIKAGNSVNMDILNCIRKSRYISYHVFKELMHSKTDELWELTMTGRTKNYHLIEDDFE